MRAILTVSVLLVAACRVGEDYQAPELAAPERFANAPEAAPELAQSDVEWWKRFGDPELERWIERGLAGSLDLRIAAQRVLEARSIVEIRGSDARPSVDAGAAVARREASTAVAGGQYLPDDAASFHQIGFDATWELDLFGRVGRGVEAAQAGYEATLEDAHAVAQRLVAEIARTYTELRGIEREIDLVDANLATQRDSAELVRSRVTAGLDDELELARIEGLIASTRARVPGLESARAARVHALAVLVGEWPANVAAELARSGALPAPPATLPALMPVELLRRRPDLRRAERELAEAAALTARATAELYPRLSLAAAFGWESEHLDDLFSSSARTFTIGPSLVAPLFRGGLLRAARRARDAQQEQALLRYERAFLEALREVEDALVGSARSRERADALELALVAQRRAVELAMDRYTNGLSDFLVVLDAERSMLAAESDLVRARTEVVTTSIALYKSLGGGWAAIDQDALAAKL